MQTYEIKESRKRQLSVVYMLGAWVGISIFQTFKFLDPGRSSTDTSAWFVFSNTFQLAIGLTLILKVGKETNELQSLGFEHMLRVKQAELAAKSSFFLVEQQEVATTRLKHSSSAGDRELFEAIGELRTTSMESAADENLESPVGSPHKTITPRKRDIYRVPVSKDDNEKIVDKISDWIVSNSSREDWRKKCFTSEGETRAPSTTDPSPIGGHEWAAYQERCYNRLHRLLDTLIETVKTEHGPGERTHWGAEDRRSKLSGIYLGQHTLTIFWSSILSVAVPAIYQALQLVFDKPGFTYWRENVVPFHNDSHKQSKCTAGDMLLHILSEVGNPDSSSQSFVCPGIELDGWPTSAATPGGGSH